MVVATFGKKVLLTVADPIDRIDRPLDQLDLFEPPTSRNETDNVSHTLTLLPWIQFLWRNRGSWRCGLEI